MSPLTHILFLCTGNSCRSQMAEGWTRHLHPALFTACSAGLATHGLNPSAVRVMAEAGVDISAQKSQHLDEFDHLDLDYVITVCDNARESCPIFPGRATVIHHSFNDPPALATGPDDLAPYRRVRDEIRRFVAELPVILKPGDPPR